MKDLLYKEFKLAKHPTLFIFPFCAAMLLIPAYPYFVAFIYTCLSIFFVFLEGRENKDILFTVSLPVRKKDIVKARCAMIAIIELVQVAISVPVGILGSRINPNPGGNEVGIEANVAFFGFVLIMYALFNIIFLPSFYKSGYKLGKPLLFAGAAVTVYIFAVEVAVQAIRPLRTFFDTTEAALMLRQLPVLLAGMAIYALSMVAAYKKSAVNFEKVDL